ncbi:MAG: hypothetical protein ACPW61_09870 [Methyloligella sp. ZOD6]
MRGALTISIAAGLAAFLVACTAQPAKTVRGSKPVDAYVMLGSIIKRCWFSPEHPLLRKDYVYHAEVAPDGSKVQISVHEKQPDGRPGYGAYGIFFHTEGPQTVLNQENKRMPPRLAAKMRYDVDRWHRGATDCNAEMPAPTQEDAPANS